MDELTNKIIRTTISRVGDIEVSVLQVGNPWHLKEIEDFITKSDERFKVLMMNKKEIKTALHLQNALQEFVNHIQAIGKEQASNEMRGHFKNWIYSLNGNLKSILDGKSSANGSHTAAGGKKGGTSTDRMETASNW